MSFLDIVSRLSATASRTEKEQILFDTFMRGEREFFVGARLALDPLITFGVKKVALIEEADDEDGTFSFRDFTALARKLRLRQLTGHAARDAINEAAASCHVATWNQFYRRILLKDLKIGVEAKTINKVLGKLVQAEPEAREFMIPVFGCQLAHDGADEKHAKKLKGVKMLDVKLDGVRLLTVLDKEAGTVAQYTREGREKETFTEITTALKGLLNELPASVVLDGEVVAKSFQDLMTQLNRKEGGDTSTMRLAVFDIIPLKDFREGLCRIPQRDRHALLVDLETSGALRRHTNGLVYVVPKITVDLDTPEGRAHADQITSEAIAAGYKEAVMYKDPAAPYEGGKRVTHWLKKKPFVEVSLEIVGFEEGRPGTKYEGMLGALICRGEDDGRLIETNVGSGLTDEQRAELWARSDELVGYIVEVRADALTKEQGSDVWSLRFPRLKGFRGTKPGEKL